METCPEYVVNDEKIASFLDVVVGSVRHMLDAGIVVEARGKWGTPIRGRFDLLESNVNYIRSLRARGPEKPAESVEFERNRNRKAAAQAEEAAIKLAVLKGELHTTDAVLAEVGPQHVACKQKMLAIPSKTARVLAAETDHLQVHKILTGEINEALAELRGFGGKSGSRNGHSPAARKSSKRVRQNALKRRRTSRKKRRAQ